MVRNQFVDTRGNIWTILKEKSQIVLLKNDERLCFFHIEHGLNNFRRKKRELQGM